MSISHPPKQQHIRRYRYPPYSTSKPRASCLTPPPLSCTPAQVDEYRVMTLSLGLLLVTVIAIDISAGTIADNLVLARRLALLNNLVRGVFLFWPVIYTPLCKYAKRDQEYADSFSLGLAPSITPAMLRCVFLCNRRRGC